MDSSIAGRVDHTLLDSLDWSVESYTLSSFLDQHGSSLPHVVKVFEGFLGDASSGTIDSGQILVLHSLHKETKILAKNSQGTELFIPTDFQVKVEMIPKNSLEESKSVRELLRTFPKYFRALSDIPSHDITSGSMFKIIRQKGYSCFECLEIINDGEEREVRLPFSLKGRFQALQDNREFLIDEVYAEEKDNLEDGELVNIHFVKSCLSTISIPGFNVESLYDLGTIRLVGEREIETVFASLLSENGKTLAVFPRDLEITVYSAKTNEHYDNLRSTIKGTQTRTLKRIERLNKLSLYQARNPVRQFCQNELKPPALSKTKSARQESIGSTEEKGSNSTPPPPPSLPLETKHKEGFSSKKMLKKAVSVPTPRPAGVCDQNTVTKKDNPSLKRPNYKPPDIPYQSQPPLPPKQRSKSLTEDKEQNLTYGHQEQESDLGSPPIPPPRLRRRQKSIGKRKDVQRSECGSTGYEPMDGFVGNDQEYVEMDGSWREKEGTLEEIFGDATAVDGDDEATESKVSGSEVDNSASRTVKEMAIFSHHVNEQRERVDSMDYENTRELKLAHLKKDGKIFPQDYVDDQRERIDSMDYENTKELKLDHLKNSKISGETVSQNDADEVRERIDSMDYENTKELKLDHLKISKISGKTDDQRERVDSMDYENTKELKLARLKRNREVMVLQNDENEQRERTDSMDYENTKELKLDRLKNLKISGKTISQNDADDQQDGADSDYENTPKVKPPGVVKDAETSRSDEELLDSEDTKELKLVPPGREASLSDHIGEEIPRKDSMDYENTKELKIPSPGKARRNQASNTNKFSGKDHHTLDIENAEREAIESGKNGVNETERAPMLVPTSQSSSSCSNDTSDISMLELVSPEDKSTRTQGRSKSETLNDSSCLESKTVAKTEQFLKGLKLGREVSSDATVQPEDTKEESLAEETNNRASVGIYYTTMADNVADHPSYYTAMAASNFLQGDLYEPMSANPNDVSYVPMNASYVEDSIYENDVSDTRGGDSDEMDDYENVDLVRTPRMKTQMAVVIERDGQHSTDAYEEVDIIHQIESSLDSKNPSTDDQGRGHEKKDIPHVNELTPSPRFRRGSEVYEEIDPPLDPGSNHLDVVARERPGSDSYEDIDFPMTIAHGYLTKTISNDTSAPPTPPQRRARKLRKEVKAGETSKDQTEVLSSSPKVCDHIDKRTAEDFEDLESLQVHMAMKESQRQVLFEQALLYKCKTRTPNSESPKEAPQANQQESCKDKVSITAAAEKVADQYVKSRPPAPPPPRKPVTYLDVEPTKKPSKPFKQKSPCNYSEIIGKAQPKHSSSREDDMEYIDDIELHYFQKEHMEIEKKRKERTKEQNKNDSESNDDMKTKDIVTGDDKVPISNEIDSGADGEPEIENSVAANIQKFQNDAKDGLQYTKKPARTKPLPKKPVVKKKPLRALSEPVISKNNAQKPITSSNSTHDPNKPITSQNISHDAHKPITLSHSSPGFNKPITLQDLSHDAHKPITLSHSSPGSNKPITLQDLSHDADKPITSSSSSLRSNRSHDASNPTTSACPSRSSDVNRTRRITSQNQSPIAPKPKPAVAKKPNLMAKRSLNPPPKPRRTFAKDCTEENRKADIQNTLNTQKTFQDTPAMNGKSVQTTVQEHSSSEEKVTSQRTKPPKPLPRRKSQI